MRRAALLDRDFFNTEAARKRFGANQRRIPFSKRNDAFVAKPRKHNLLLGPHAALPPQPRIEKIPPLRRRPLFQCFDVVPHFEQSAAGAASVDNLLQRVTYTTPGEALKPRLKLHVVWVLNKAGSFGRFTKLQPYYIGGLRGCQ